MKGWVGPKPAARSMMATSPKRTSSLMSLPRMGRVPKSSIALHKTKVVHHGRAVIFQMAEAMAPSRLSADILERIVQRQLHVCRKSADSYC